MNKPCIYLHSVIHALTKSCLNLCNPMTVACQAALSMEFYRQAHWSGLPFPTPGDLHDPRINPASPESPALQADSLPLHRLG